MVKTAEKSVKSKGWDWSQVKKEHWTKASDEFLPIALRWKEMGKQSVLDIGCGIGRHTLFLAELGFDVTALDISPDGIEILKKEAARRNLESKIKTIVCDMLDMPCENNSFDGVLGFLSVTHTDYAGLKAIITRIHDILKTHGRLYMTFNSKNSPAFSDATNIKVDEYTVIKNRGIEKGIPHTYLDHEDIVRLLAHYKILKIQQIQDYYDEVSSVHFFVEAEKKN
jgi:SAM-dependent methyltransferase